MKKTKRSPRVHLMDQKTKMTVAGYVSMYVKFCHRELRIKGNINIEKRSLITSVQYNTNVFWYQQYNMNMKVTNLILKHPQFKMAVFKGQCDLVSKMVSPEVSLTETFS